MTRIVTGIQQHTFALFEDGRVFGWGLTDNGQLGIGFTNAQYSNVRRPYQVPLPGPCIDLSSNAYTSCFLLNNTKIYCTGANSECLFHWIHIKPSPCYSTTYV